MAADGWYIYTGREAVPDYVTRVRIDESVTVIRARAFCRHPNIKVVECHDRVKTVGGWAFFICPSLRRVIMPGVEVVKQYAFEYCKALAIVECGKLEIIKVRAFEGCESLGSINLPFVKIVEHSAFSSCEALTKIKFGGKLESIRQGAFSGCTSLERITIPLKDGLITDDNVHVFRGCENLKHVDLVERSILDDTIDALQMEDWKTDMDRDMLSIDQILPNTSAGDDSDDVGGKALAIRMWISSVLRKIIRYKAQHHSLLNEAATTLQHALPQDIMMNNVLPFLELPSFTFEGGGYEEEEEEATER